MAILFGRELIYIWNISKPCIKEKTNV